MIFETKIRMGYMFLFRHSFDCVAWN